MDIMVFTHANTEKLVRRFFVNKTEMNLYRMIEMEISKIVSGRIFDGTYRELSLRNLYEYVENRWYSLDKTKFKDSVYYCRLINHMKDYCDIRYAQVFGKLYHFPYRMYKFSELLAINKEK